MAKLIEASDEVVELFDKVRDNTTIRSWVEFKVFCNNKQKKDVCKAIKSNELVEKLSDGVNFAIVINESIFNELPADLQWIAIEDCLAGVAVSESDTVSYEQPDLAIHSGIYHKYKDKAIVLKESIKSLYDKQKQQEDEAKAMAGGKRGRRPKGQ
jgi:hypothetical protein